MPAPPGPEPVLNLHVLVSGSEGNSTLIEAERTRVLVDCGVSGREAARRLESVGCPPETLTAIVVTHEHTDHMQGVGVLSRRFDVPVYLTAGTLAACRDRLKTVAECRVFEPGKAFTIGDLEVRPFSIPHDASEPVGFTFHHGKRKIGVATDLGFSTELARRHLSACQLLVLESNHDPEMLANGPYPWELKRRIRGREGHLSNADAGDLLEAILQADGGRLLEGVVLAHLSAKNNSPDLARRVAEEVLERHRLKGKVRLEVAGRHETVTIASRGGRGKPAEAREGVSAALPCTAGVRLSEGEEKVGV
jgi:phosphoribosyl 1,2-cyclic phosphodiesterase